MYQLNDTIVAVSSPTSEQRVIIRITGPDTIGILQHICSAAITKNISGIAQTTLAVDSELKIDAILYLFLAPHSYTGETLAEIHAHTNASVTEVLIGKLLSKGARTAGPGEFTARAYLNGKIDLAQAEAVNEIITSSNEFQLAAAQKLLAGRLAETTEKLRSTIMDTLSLIEAGMDFSDEDIEFITQEAAVKRLAEIRKELEQLLAAGSSYESVIDLPAVGIAGAPNAGKSSLLNELLGSQRSIVSEQRKTTRDILTGLLKMSCCQCILFDCAGLIAEAKNILDELAQQAAIEAINSASVVVFSVDISKTDFSEDIAIRKLIKPKSLIAVATKVDLLSEDVLAKHIAELNKLFDTDFLATSAKTGNGIELLREKIDRKIIQLTPADTRYASRDTLHALALTARHRHVLRETINNTKQAVDELKADNDEVAAMLLRAAYQNLSNIEAEHIEEQILENIFSNFCIGK